MVEDSAPGWAYPSTGGAVLVDESDIRCKKEHGPGARVTEERKMIQTAIMPPCDKSEPALPGRSGHCRRRPRFCERRVRSVAGRGSTRESPSRLRDSSS